MRRADQDSTTSMPRALLVVAALLLSVRIAAEVMPERHEPDLVAWRDAAPAPTDALGSRPTLYYFSADWCQPCRRLDDEVFRDPEMAAYVNEVFVPVRVMVGNEDREKRAPAIRELMERHHVTSFPTLIVERPGRKPARMQGYPSRRKVVAFLHSILPPKP